MVATDVEVIAVPSVVACGWIVPAAPVGCADICAWSYSAAVITWNALTNGNVVATTRGGDSGSSSSNWPSRFTRHARYFTGCSLPVVSRPASGSRLPITTDR